MFYLNSKFLAVQQFFELNSKLAENPRPESDLEPTVNPTPKPREGLETKLIREPVDSRPISSTKLTLNLAENQEGIT